MNMNMKSKNKIRYLISLALTSLLIGAIYYNYLPDVRYVRSFTYGKWDTAIRMLEKGVDPNIKSSRGYNVMYYASYNAPLEIIKILAEKGADYKSSNPNSNVPILICAQESRWDVVKYFLSIDDSFPESLNQEIFLWAIAQGQIDIANILIEKGLSVEFYSRRGYTPLHLALISEYLLADMQKMKATVELLIKNGANPNAPARKKVSTADSHLGVRVNGNQPDEDDRRTAMQMAIDLGDNEIVSILKSKTQ